MNSCRSLFLSGLAGLFLTGCTELELTPAIEKDLSLTTAATATNLFAIEAMATDVIDFESYPRGTILSEVYGKNGAGPVAVVGRNPLVPAPNAAMIFDSSSPTGGDPDLGTPNQDFGGPGIGTGGESGSPYENAVALGKLLIITEDFDSNDPDDADLRGGMFTFNFSALDNVTVYSMHILDVEAVESAATVTFFDSDNVMIGSSFTLPKTGNNGVFNFAFGQGVSGVAKMIVTINGSGAIDNITFSAEPPPPPGPGCTYTAGYWANHTKYSSAKRDDGWDNIMPDGEDTRFFLSGKTYLQVLKTAPRGNAYYILSKQYVAAKLNTLNGASAPDEVKDALAKSKALFQKYTPAQIAAMRASNPVRKKFIHYAFILDQYNNGKIGPGHCD